MDFKFATAGQIVFGSGTIENIGNIAEGMGRRVFLITGKDGKRAAPVSDRLKKKGMPFFSFSIKGEPTTDTALVAVAEARQAGCDVVIGIGGGSVLDAGKVVAALLTNRGDLMDYLEVIGKGQPLRSKPAAYIAIPTTAGTGAEVTSNAVLDSPRHRVKVSMRSHLMLPDLALIDPGLTLSMSPELTAITGLDAFTQLLEAFVSMQANPITDAICREGLKRAAGSLKKAYVDGRDSSARRDMCLASVFGGLALANAKLGAVHGFAGPLGGMFDAPHGALCAALLPYVMEINLEALKKRAQDSVVLKRYDEIACIITDRPHAKASEAIEWIQELCLQLKAPRLAHYGIGKADFPDIIAKSQNSSSMKGNPIVLTEAELRSVLDMAL